MKNAAVGNNPFIDLGTGIEGQSYRTTPKPRKDIIKEMEFEKIVEKNERAEE